MHAAATELVMSRLTHSAEPAGIFTGHTHRPKGYRMTFGVGTYYNVFGSVDVRVGDGPPSHVKMTECLESTIDLIFIADKADENGVYCVDRTQHSRFNAGGCCRGGGGGGGRMIPLANRGSSRRRRPACAASCALCVSARLGPRAPPCLDAAGRRQEASLPTASCLCRASTHSFFPL